jgi:putative tricarboxylic transport membrane protein
MKLYDWPAAPMILGLVLGPLFETSLRQSLTLSHGSSLIFLSRPISGVLLVAALVAVLAPTLMRLAGRSRALARA